MFIFNFNNFVCYLKHIQTISVTEVSAADFSAHVPPVESIRCEFNPAAIETHAGYSRQRIPAEFQLFKPFVPEI